MKKLLIANRGEIAIRISRAASELGIETVAIYSEDDGTSLHCRNADHAVALTGTGPAAYLDIEQIINLAKTEACDAIHPGYGFLSENTKFASHCAEAGICFVGPTVLQLEQFGNKSEARLLADSLGIPLVPGTEGDTSLAAARKFMTEVCPGQTVLIKAIAGGGGRGMRIVQTPDELDKAFERAGSEAKMAFGSEAVYLERLVERARHIEVQIIGDGNEVAHLWERECTLQRNHQKLIEIAPSPTLTEAQRQPLLDAAIKMAAASHYRSLGTFEFLVDANNPDQYFFIEANPRLQVEHTVTEAVTGIDLVQAQLRIAGGETLKELNLDRSAPKGFAIQARINMEVLGSKGRFKPSGGNITSFEPPSGPGIRVDHFAYSGYKTSTRFDSLLAKLIVHSPMGYERAVAKLQRALREFRIEGFDTNLSFLQALLGSPEFKQNNIYTRYVDENLDQLAQAVTAPPLYFQKGIEAESKAQPAPGTKSGLAGSVINKNDPLAVLSHGKSNQPTKVPSDISTAVPEGMQAIEAPLQGTIIEVTVNEGDTVKPGSQLAVMEAMKMEHVITAQTGGTVAQLNIQAGETVLEGFNMILIDVAEGESDTIIDADEVDLTYVRPDLQEALDRHALGFDESRPEAVARRHKTNHRTARENLADLIDADSFIEYGPLTIAAQRRRRKLEDLRQNTPADGMVTGIGSVNKALFPDRETQCIIMSYDYMVLAGTQGGQNHRKKDRMFELAEKLKLPVILFAEGGGGRPGDTDGLGIAGLDCLAFQLWGKLSGLVPRIGITTGRCFAGNAALLGASDVVIATRDSNIGMGGPAMIEGGGLGIFTPDEVGPMDVQVPNGVVDIAVDNEEQAVAAAKQYLSYFQGPLKDWTCQDQRGLRHAIPENRLRIYDIRKLIAQMADDDSVLELRPEFALGMITAFARIEGRPVGIVANNPAFLSGAIDSDGADKAARFLQLCDAFDIPVVSLCDTPGIMVGPEIEKTALVRHAARMFVTGANLEVPVFTIVLRKGYGLGAQAMAGGGFKASAFTVAWPTGEFGGMGLEGAVKLGYRKELEAITDPDERAEMFEQRVASMYEHGKAVNFATAFELDDVIDPADTRRWIATGLKSIPAPVPRTHRKRTVDTW